MTEFEKQELVSSALDGLTLALDSLNDLDEIDFEVEVILGKIENAYDELLRFYES
jgi:hypothetical protein